MKISEEVANTVADILEEGVSGNGGAKNAYVDGYKIAAKTGTSQKFDVLDSNGNSYLRIGSTVAYTESLDNGICAIIVVDEPQCEVKYGSVVAAPYISSLFSEILSYLQYEKEDNTSSQSSIYKSTLREISLIQPCITTWIDSSAVALIDEKKL